MDMEVYKDIQKNLEETQETLKNMRVHMLDIKKEVRAYKEALLDLCKILSEEE